MPTMEKRRSAFSCSIVNNRVVVLGGGEGAESNETLDLQQNKWLEGTSLPKSVIGGYSVVAEGYLYVLESWGEVMRMAEDGNTWDRLVAKVGLILFDRPFNQALRVSKELIGC